MNSRIKRRNRSWNPRIGCGYCEHENHCNVRMHHLRNEIRYPGSTRMMAVLCGNFKLTKEII